jgi:8-amino-7-oxononanoate synthase
MTPTSKNSSLDEILGQELEDFAAQGLRRELRRIAERDGARMRIGDRTLLNFSSNDYLDLSRHPDLVEASARAAREHGAGSAASRLVCGSLEVHHQLEETIADWKRCDAALAFGSGFAAAIGTLPALVGPEDILILDKLAHACCIDAARLSGATLRIFRHNDLNQLEQHLRWADSRASNKRPRIVVVTESVFSMDGDVAPLREIVELKDRHGAWLFLDEAHAAGLFGPDRSGLAEQEGLADRVDIHLGTLGKAVGASGGFIAGSRTLVDYLVHRARSFVFSTAPAPAAAAAAKAGIECVRSPEGTRRAAITWERARQLAALLPGSPAAFSAILPWIIGAEAEAVAQSTRLRDAGILAPAIRYPTVARGRARIRLTVTAGHTSDDLIQLQTALRSSTHGV